MWDCISCSTWQIACTDIILLHMNTCKSVRLEFLTAVKIIMFFWVLAPCWLVGRGQRSERNVYVFRVKVMLLNSLRRPFLALYIIPLIPSIVTSTLKMEKVRSLRCPVLISQQNPEECHYRYLLLAIQFHYWLWSEIIFRYIYLNIIHTETKLY